MGPRGHQHLHPYQPDKPNRGLRLRSYPVQEQYGCIFMWYQPHGKEPQWELPDIFHKFPQFNTDPNAYYRPYPEFSSRADAIPVHPQIVAENGPDSSHFRYVHGATVTPVCLHWEHVDEEWRFLTGWPDARSDDPNKMALRIHSHFSGLGFAMSAFEGSSNHRLIFACTPVDDEVSDMFYSIWWPKEPGGASDIPPEHVRAKVEAVPQNRVGGLRHLALPEVRRASGARQDRRQTLYGHAQMGHAVLRGTSRRDGAAPRMRIDVRELVTPGRTAVVTQECQGAVIGPDAGLRALADEAQRVALPNIKRLLPAARAASVHVVHCLVQRRPDGLGSNRNAKIFAIGRNDVAIAPGTPGAALLPELGPEAGISCSRDGTAWDRWAVPTSTQSCATSA